MAGIKFNVFGKIMSVHRNEGEWLLFLESDTSMRVRVYEVIIPSELEEGVIASYLFDIYHENANQKYASVERLR